jgi:glycerol-3-phosphate dehydrogenase
MSLAERAKIRGANLFTNARLEGIDRTAHGDLVLRTNRGELEVDIMINAAGPWLGQIGEKMGYKIPIELLKTTFYEVNKIMFPESYTFVFHRSKGGTIIPNSSMGVTMLGRGDVNMEVSDPADSTPIVGGEKKTLEALKSISKLISGIKEDQLCPVTGTKVRIKSAEGLRESSIINHGSGLYTVSGGKLTSSLYIAEQVKKEISKG